MTKSDTKMFVGFSTQYFYFNRLEETLAPPGINKPEWYKNVCGDFRVA